ncbi:MAG: tyrosine-type recombinase/integrase, partial [Bacteroidia bacterium]|nr:tyrosine-type recombinase/integrase [Bacteroidia bacterium]
QYLRKLILNIERAELEAEERQVAFTKDMVRIAATNGTLFEETNVIDKFYEYLREKTEYRPSTIKHEKEYIRKLQLFTDAQKGITNAPLYFNDLTLSFLNAFDKYISRIYGMYTHSSALCAIRRYCVKAQREGLLKFNPFDGFQMPKVEYQIKPSLNEDEIYALENLSSEELKSMGRGFELVRDRFLFSCYTGLRISDSVSILKSNIVKEERGLSLQITTQKTGQTVTLPLYLLFNGKPERIALKYLELNNKDGYLFPLFSHTTVHTKLKKIFKHVGISDANSFHSARHTCATMLADKVNDPFVIKDVLGHSGIGTSMLYISRSKKTAERKLATIKWNDNNTKKDSLTMMSNNVREICIKKGFSPNQIFVILGNLIENPNRYEIIKTWVDNVSSTDTSEETIDTKLQTLFNTL